MSKEVKIGTFAVTILVASFFLINYLRGEDIFNREIEISSRFENVEGLVASAPVFIKGYNKNVHKYVCIAIFLPPANRQKLR